MDNIKDPADDGMEISVIRILTKRPDNWYKAEIYDARCKRALEDLHTLEVEAEFLRKVGIFE
jgi:hypothetical protein